MAAGPIGPHHSQDIPPLLCYNGTRAHPRGRDTVKALVKYAAGPGNVAVRQVSLRPPDPDELLIKAREAMIAARPRSRHSVETACNTLRARSESPFGQGSTFAGGLILRSVIGGYRFSNVIEGLVRWPRGSAGSDCSSLN